jgi:hypothetical protein
MSLNDIESYFTELLQISHIKKYLLFYFSELFKIDHFKKVHIVLLYRARGVFKKYHFYKVQQFLEGNRLLFPPNSLAEKVSSLCFYLIPSQNRFNSLIFGETFFGVADLCLFSTVRSILEKISRYKNIFGMFSNLVRSVQWWYLGSFFFGWKGGSEFVAK